MKINRIAVATFFFTNGFLYANWAGRLPEIQHFFNISNAILGILLFLAALGALLAMPFSGWLTARFGSERVTYATGMLFCCTVPMLVFVPNYWVAGIFFFILGIANGTLDVAMNGQAVFVERAYNKPIMSSFHGVFSIGMALGAAVSAGFAKLNWSLFSHLLLVAGAGIIAITWAMQHLLKELASETTNKSETPAFMLPTKAILPLGIIAFCGMTGEGTMADWSALFVNKVVGESEYFSALAFGIFGTSMTVGRFLGDYFTAKFGKRKLLIYSSLFTIVGLFIALIYVSLATSILGFFLVGLGLANVVPIVYSSAGNTEGVEPSVGIAMATSIGYAGFFVGPPTIGFLADHFGLRVALCFTLVLFVVMLVLCKKMLKK
jgi:MFS family permease